MEILGLLTLLLSSWYIWKLTNNFLDEQTKNNLANEFNILKLKFKEISKIFTKRLIKEAWEKYKEEDGVLANKKQDS